MKVNSITFYISSKGNFFDLQYNINCSIDNYIACNGVDKLFDIESVNEKKLIDIGSGIMVSEPVKVERNLGKGGEIFASISHNGVFACYSNRPHSFVRFTDLTTERQFDMKVGNCTLTAFYDNSLVMLTWNENMTSTTIEEIFEKKDVSCMTVIGTTLLLCYTDVSIVHSTRTIYYCTMSKIPHVYDVDTMKDEELDFGTKLYTLASLTGIDVGVRGVFNTLQDDRFTYSLNKDFSTSLVLDHNPDWGIHILIPSNSEPCNLRKAAKIYYDRKIYIDRGTQLTFSEPVKCKEGQSIVRLYQNIFLMFDSASDGWCLTKILVP